jgi:hypothetical protein
MRSAGIRRNIAADRAGGLARRIRRIEQPVCFDRIGHPGVDAASLDERAAIAMINRKDAVHPRQCDHDPAAHGQNGSAQARARAAWNKRKLMPGAKLDHCGDLIRQARQHDHGR